jgi:hypothetical protein
MTRKKKWFPALYKHLDCSNPFAPLPASYSPDGCGTAALGCDSSSRPLSPRAAFAPDNAGVGEPGLQANPTADANAAFSLQSTAYGLQPSSPIRPHSRDSRTDSPDDLASTLDDLLKSLQSLSSLPNPAPP